eukprot:355056-Chlamydomonas_euryale.AAC.1
MCGLLCQPGPWARLPGAVEAPGHGCKVQLRRCHITQYVCIGRTSLASPRCSLCCSQPHAWAAGQCVPAVL